MKNTIIILAILIGVLIGGYYFNNQVGASVQPGGEYNATTTSSVFQNHNVLKTGQGTLGSVVITGTNPGVVTIYDATTTNASLRTKTATTTLANFQTTATPGTYTFDVVFTTGLLVDFGGGTGSTTITWR